jgi:transcriptional regulator
VYVPKFFEETRLPVLHELMQTHPFGALVALTPDGLEASHIPFELHSDLAELGVLRAHVARANPVWRDASPDTECLVIFQGPHGYISPSWLPSKQDTGKVVPTWNYAVVHAYGRLRIVEDEAWLRSLVESLSDRHEAGMKEPWKVAEAPADFTAKLLRAIVGVEIEVTRLVGKWKLGQNRSCADVDGMVAGLEQEGKEQSAALAELTRTLASKEEKNNQQPAR